MLVSLGLDSAEFDKGLNNASDKTQKFSRDVARLKADIDPAWAAMNKFRSEVQLLQRAMNEGAISQDQFSARVKLAAERYKSGAAGFVQASNQMRFGAQNLGFQLQDVAVQLGSGTSAARVFAQQGPQIVGAISMMSGTTSKFATFMQGPWGAAIGVGVAALGFLATKLFDTSDASEKAEKSTRSFTDVLRDSKSSWEEISKAAKDYGDQLQKNRAITLDTIQLEAKSISSRLGEAIAIRQQLQALLDKRQAEANEFDPLRPAATQLQEIKNVNAVQAAVDANKKALGDLQRSAGEVVIKAADAIASLQSDPQAKIKAGFDILRNSARATIKDVDALSKRLADLNKQETAALKAMQDAASKNKKGSGLFGQQVSASEAANIARSAGLQVNSSTRSYAQQKALYDAWVAQGRPADNPVAMPGTSAHEGAKGHWALDIQFAKGVTPELLKKVFADQGVNLSKVIKERGHFHIEGSTGQADTAARDAQREEEKAARDTKDFADQSATLNSQLLDAKKANVNDVGTLAQLARDQVNVEAEKLRADIEGRAATNPLIAAHKAELEAVVEQVRQQKLITIDTKEQARLITDITDRRLDAHQQAVEQLSLEEDLATTTSERRRLALEILDHEKEEARIQAQRILDLYALGQATQKQAAQAQDTLNNLNNVYALKGRGVLNGTRSPLEQYLADMDPSKIGDRVESAMVDELESVRRGIDDAISSALGVQDPFLKSLIDMFIEQVLIRPIAQALQSHMGGGGGGFFGQLLGAVAGSIGGGGLDVGGAIAGGQAALSSIPIITPFARGTDFAPGGLAMVGERGPELVNLPRGAQVIPNHELRDMARNDNMPPMNINFYGAVDEKAMRRTVTQAGSAAAAQYSKSRRNGIAG